MGATFKNLRAIQDKIWRRISNISASEASQIDDAITNNFFFKWRNSGDTADVNLLGLNSSNKAVVTSDYLVDQNANEILETGATSSAVNHVKITNAATGNPPKIEAAGETNVSLILNGKGTGVVQAGEAVTNGLVLKGRLTTGTLNGSALAIGSTFTWSEGVELRYTISDWSGLGNGFKGAYIRAQSDVDNASGAVLGIETYAVANASGASSIQGILSYAYAKGDTTDTVGWAYGVQGEFSMDAGRANTLTITNEAAGVLSKVTSGKVDAYTKIHAYVARLGDMDGGSRKYGSGLRLLDGTESGTSSLSNVLYTDMAADYFLQVSAADIGAVDDTISGQTPGTINALVKCKFGTTDFYLYGYAAGPS